MNRMHRYLPDTGRSELFPPITGENWSKPPERSVWASVWDWVGAGLCVSLCFAGILAGVWLVSYVATLGVLAGLGL